MTDWFFHPLSDLQKRPFKPCVALIQTTKPQLPLEIPELFCQTAAICKKTF
jgi:hypothetical protein